MQAIFLMAGALSLVAATDLPTKLQPEVPAPPASLALDTEFRSPLFVDPRPAYRTLLLPDGNYLHYSSSDTLTDQRTGAVVRFLPNGTRDTAFNFNRDYKDVSAAVAVSEGKVVVAAAAHAQNVDETGQQSHRAIRKNIRHRIADRDLIADSTRYTRQQNDESVCRRKDIGNRITGKTSGRLARRFVELT